MFGFGVLVSRGMIMLFIIMGKIGRRVRLGGKIKIFV